jgi:glycine oxidase
MSKRLVILGGGVIGLSIAWEALRRGMGVTVIDRSDLPGRASWAGAGILAPGHPQKSAHPLDRLSGNSRELHQKWSMDLLAETGLENGLIECGGVYLASTLGEKATLAAQMQLWESEDVKSTSLNLSEMENLLGPEFRPTVEIQSAWYVPTEMQICNTAHLAALAEAILGRNGEIVQLSKTAATNFETSGSSAANGTQSIIVENRLYDCEHLCLAAGAWSGQIAESRGFHLPTTPVRGQMVLYKLPYRAFVPILNLGSRYIVPRADGHVLVGSTMEEAGFDASTTEEGLAGLKSFAASLFPILNESHIVRSWAGLRPASFDGMPYVGVIPGSPQLLIATGHMRSGLQWSTSTAVMICNQIENRNIEPELQRLLSPGRVLDRKD